MSLLLRVRVFFVEQTTKKTVTRLLGLLREIGVSQTFADRKGNAFIVEKNRKNLLCFLLLSLLFKHFDITKH